MKLSLILFLVFPLLAFSQTDSIFTWQDGERVLLSEYIARRKDKAKAFISGMETLPAPPFFATDMAGKTQDLQEYEGRVLVLIFWNSHSQSCLDQLPALYALRANLPPDLVSILMFTNDRKAEMERFLERYGDGAEPPFPIVTNSSEFARKDWGGKYLELPTIFVLDQFQVIHKIIAGVEEEEKKGWYQLIKEVIEGLL